MAATSSTAEGDCLPVGSVVTCITCHGAKLNGEVLAYDSYAKMLVIKSATSGGKSRVQVVNVGLVGEIKLEREASQGPPPIPHMNYDKIKRRANEAVDKKKRSVCPPNISLDGQRVFSTIRKTIEDVFWEKDTIVVLKSVVVSSPYSLDSISVKSGAANNTQAQQTLTQVQKIVEKFYRDKQQPNSSELAALEQETAGLTLAQ